ncbi:MAG: hypothetical protein F7C34_04675, partial [Desulfurococcales archaeon]|nr:hypothetical protein [Desulfurococcales archaeon]
MAWKIVEIEAIDAPTLTASGPGGAGVHGPAVRMASLSYPRPSMLAGALASLAFRLGIAGRAPEPESGFEDLEHLLRALGIENLRPGLVRDEKGNLYVYLGASFLPELDCLLNTIRKQAADESSNPLKAYRDLVRGEACPGVRAVKEAYTGIALERSSKTVRSGLIYERERLAYTPRASIAALAKTSIGSHVRGLLALGGDKALARVVLREAGPPSRLLMRGEGEEWLLVLAAPALLGLESAGEILLNPPVQDEQLPTRLARSLLSKYSCAGDSEALLVPRNEYVLQVVLPGWSSLLNKGRGGYRRPHIEVPPGTILRVRASRDCVE